MNATATERKNGTMKGWTTITDEMAAHYGYTTQKGSALHTLSMLCEKADEDGSVRYEDNSARQGLVCGKIGLIGQIPSCIEHGTDFTQEEMGGRLCGLEAAYPGYCYALTTHDLNSFNIASIGDLVTEIRMS